MLIINYSTLKYCETTKLYCSNTGNKIPLFLPQNLQQNILSAMEQCYGSEACILSKNRTTLWP